MMVFGCVLFMVFAYWGPLTGTSKGTLVNLFCGLIPPFTIVGQKSLITKNKTNVKVPHKSPETRVPTCLCNPDRIVNKNGESVKMAIIITLSTPHDLSG